MHSRFNNMQINRNSLYKKYFCSSPRSNAATFSQRNSQPQKLQVTNVSSSTAVSVRKPMERLDNMSLGRAPH